MQDFLSHTHDVDKMIQELNRRLIRDLKREYQDCCDEMDLSSVLEEICAYENQTFIFIMIYIPIICIGI